LKGITSSRIRIKNRCSRLLQMSYKDSAGGWAEAPRAPQLEAAEAHVWRASLRQSGEMLRVLSATLAPDEQARAERFYFRKDRESFVIARGVLRDILGRYLNTAPARIRFSYGAYGKPVLTPETGGAHALRFNLSHAHEVVCYAIAREREVGVDVEWMRDDIACLELAERFFSLAEVATLHRLPPDQLRRSFFNCWTRKEAYIKARGEGLSHPLEAYTVSLAPGEQAALLVTDRDPEEAGRWTLMEFAPGEGYVGALAVAGAQPVLHCLDWYM
jgi:4'-phosphopantetheinyl transferase